MMSLYSANSIMDLACSSDETTDHPRAVVLGWHYQNGQAIDESMTELLQSSQIRLAKPASRPRISHVKQLSSLTSPISVGWTYLV